MALCFEFGSKGHPTTFKVRLLQTYTQTTETRLALDKVGIADSVISSNTYQNSSATFEVYCEHCGQVIEAHKDYGKMMSLAKDLNTSKNSGRRHK